MQIKRNWSKNNDMFFKRYWFLKTSPNQETDCEKGGRASGVLVSILGSPIHLPERWAEGPSGYLPIPLLPPPSLACRIFSGFASFILSCNHIPVVSTVKPLPWLFMVNVPSFNVSSSLLGWASLSSFPQVIHILRKGSEKMV